MSFFQNLLDKIRGINQQSRAETIVRSYVFGVILSGNYIRWKTDSHPTFLCLGVYQKNGKNYIHGIQLHAVDANYVMQLVKNIRDRGVVTSPLLFFRYLCVNNPRIIQNGYRTYLPEYADFKVVHQGFTKIQGYFKSEDPRDGFLEILSPRKQIVVDMNSIKENITRVINTVKVWR